MAKSRKSSSGLPYQVKIRRVGRDHLNNAFPEIVIRPTSGPTVRQLLSLDELNSEPSALISVATMAGLPLSSKQRQETYRNEVQRQLDNLRDLATRSEFDVATRVGWFGKSFVTPHKVYRRGDRRIYSRLGKIDRTNRWRPSGTLSEWKKVAKWAGKHNRLLIFAACAAFAAPLLELLGMEGFGFLLVGETSIGKSTVSDFASSVWGGDPNHPRGFKDSWYSTANKFERLAIQTRDSLFVPDDTKDLEGSPGGKKAAENLARAIFTLVGGVGKSRFTDNEAPVNWLNIFWATSNQTTQEIFEAGGIPYDPSYAVRLIEIHAEAKHGAFDHIPEGHSAPAFADQIRARLGESYGSAADAYLEYLVEWRAKDEEQLVDWLRKRIGYFWRKLKVDEKFGADARVAEKFAVLYAAGYLAQKAAVVPWSRRRVEAAITELYGRHRRQLTESQLEHNHVEKVRQFICDHRNKFIDATTALRSLTDDELVNSIGFVTRSKHGPKEFSFLPACFAKAFGTDGINPVIAALKDAKLLIHDTGKAKTTKKNQVKRRLRTPTGGDDGRKRVYCIPERILHLGRL